MTAGDDCGCGGGADESADHTGHERGDHEEIHDGGNAGPTGEEPEPSADVETLTVSVPEMDCPSCAGKVENSVRKLDGITAVDPQITTGTLTVSHDPEETTPDAIADRIERAGYTVEHRDETTATFTVPEMDCPSCVGKVENALEQPSGISTYEAKLTTGTVRVTYDADSLSPSRIVDAIESAGYEVTGSDAEGDSEGNDTDASPWHSPRAIKTWISGVFVALGLVFEFGLPAGDSVATVVGTELFVADVLFLIADRKSTRLNSSHSGESRMPSSA